MSLIIIFILAISLSMDAFSLSLIYGTLNLDKKLENILGIIVGIFHFFIPIFGYSLGKIILNIIKVNPDIIVGIILIILGIEMLISIKKEEQVKLLKNIFSIIIFAFTVSIDSFSVGITFGATNTNILLSCFIFSIVSCFFTYLGLKLGKRLNNIFGNITILIGAIILIVLGFTYLT